LSDLLVIVPVGWIEIEFFISGIVVEKAGSELEPESAWAFTFGAE